MKVRFPIGLFLALGLAACSGATPATDAAPLNPADISPSPDQPGSVATVPSVIFIQYLNQQAPALLCEQDAAIGCLKLPAELCKAAVAESAQRCGPLLLERWPSSFPEDADNAMLYSYQYRQCILADWIQNFGLTAERLASCGAVATP